MTSSNRHFWSVVLLKLLCSKKFTLKFSFLSFPKNTITSIKCSEISYVVASPRCSQGKQSKTSLKFAPTKLRTLTPVRQFRAWTRQRSTCMQRQQKLLLYIMFVIKKAMISDLTLSINSDFHYTCGCSG